ncbi:hypothetical protein [Clostridium sp. JS66]|uniref:endonuclease/exonuclease/phosphatase family protein n=1 Tax=Clostridium sp. JS66 TaxID=3064705 RepID=UPI00298DE9F7|nr:hypothetical protein [Clostridium sp. JS66]WPC39541.1 hypothetical protein Q6H37_16650 [Clostridium sp. JS66]
MKRTGNVKLSVMTWNVYLGAELTPLFTTCSAEQIPELATQVFRQFLATNFPERAKVIANQIDLKKPDIIGLQEANFKNNFQINISKQTFTILRGWSALDVCFQENVFRIVNTHLDTDSLQVQAAQANELLDGPGKTEKVLILQYFYTK